MRIGIAVALSLVWACGGAEPPPPAAADRPVATVAEVEAERPARPISGRDARQLVAAGAVLLDVRTGGEFTIRHIDGAINVPLQELEERLGELDPDTPTVVYCMSGHRSEKAGRILRANGFGYVFDLGAMTAY